MHQHPMKLTTARLGVIILLMAYIGQMVSVGAHAATMAALTQSANSDQPPCHDLATGVDHTEHQISAKNKNSTFKSCCKQGCSKLSCHALSAILNSIFIPGVAPAHSWKFREHNPARHQLASSLYRPPILG